MVGNVQLLTLVAEPSAIFRGSSRGQGVAIEEEPCAATKERLAFPLLQGLQHFCQATAVIEAEPTSFFVLPQFLALESVRQTTEEGCVVPLVLDQQDQRLLQKAQGYCEW